jgi:hypothetical protein
MNIDEKIFRNECFGTWLMEKMFIILNQISKYDAK